MSNPVPREPQNPSQYQKGNLKAIQKEVDEVVNVMRSNVEKVLERDEKLSELDQRANNLSASATQWQKTSSQIKKKYWWKNMKMTLLLVGGVVLLLIVIIIFTVGIPSSSSVGTDTQSENIPPSSDSNNSP